MVEHLQAVDGLGTALLDLHMALGNTDQACAVAEARAKQEQAAGNFKVRRRAAWQGPWAHGLPAELCLVDLAVHCCAAVAAVT